ncbi:conserved hypothetical protein [Verticillium alfalfae VaMs.102]|uniref:LPXTG-domain-containing protein n=1 Tax=Verticillium alfalfae (strain VaMs.102 / ATCC MYA-4576 / FGSC 10136) TaxID=526221 RepID=C9S943_VERA1|nr:conserved hypothetical protein [Verticillium alfalfae VaMs.102]EEY14091.1 conserved hypothetical protein [Verticillium alfalfae VaMs.102]
MAPRHIARALGLLSLASSVLSLYVTPESDCAALCLGSANETISSTEASISASDIACRDAEYSSSSSGIRYRNCIDCLSKSQETDGEESDLQWMLYNMRYALNTCLFDDSTAVNSPCIINYACEPLEDALRTGLSTPGEQNFDYCTADEGAFSKKWHWSCVSCLKSSGTQVYLSNFLQALKAGCEQKPELGDVLTMRGEIFSNTLLNITVTNTTLPGEGGADSSTMTTGTLVGIGVGGGLGLLGAIALTVACCRRRKKRKAAEKDDLDRTPPPDRSNASSFTAINHSPFLRDHKKSPSISTEYELQEKQKHINNADYYDRMEEEARIGRAKASYNFDPRLSQHGPGSAMPTHPAYNPQRTRPTPTLSKPILMPLKTESQAACHAPDHKPHLAVAHHPASTGRSSAEPPITGTSTTRTAQQLPGGIPPPPPGPPPSQAHVAASKTRSTRAPSLVLPSLPRIRMPKRYAPPTINVEGATPVDGDRHPADDMQISEPIALHEARFTDKPLGGPVVLADSAPKRNIDPRVYENDQPINSGKSTLFGWSGN